MTTVAKIIRRVGNRAYDDNFAGLLEELDSVSFTEREKDFIYKILFHDTCLFRFYYIALSDDDESSDDKFISDVYKFISGIGKTTDLVQYISNYPEDEYMTKYTRYIKLLYDCDKKELVDSDILKNDMTVQVCKLFMGNSKFTIDMYQKARKILYEYYDKMNKIFLSNVDPDEYKIGQRLYCIDKTIDAIMWNNLFDSYEQDAYELLHADYVQALCDVYAYYGDKEYYLLHNRYIIILKNPKVRENHAKALSATLKLFNFNKTNLLVIEVIQAYVHYINYLDSVHIVSLKKTLIHRLNEFILKNTYYIIKVRYLSNISYNWMYILFHAYVYLYMEKADAYRFFQYEFRNELIEILSIQTGNTHCSQINKVSFSCLVCYEEIPVKTRVIKCHTCKKLICGKCYRRCLKMGPYRCPNCRA